MKKVLLIVSLLYLVVFAAMLSCTKNYPASSPAAPMAH